MTDQVICYGTAWVVPSCATKTLAPDTRPPPGTPHVTSPGLDSSFVTNLFIHSTGKTWEGLLAAARDQTVHKPLLLRVGGSSYTSLRTYHLYDCADRFCQSVSQLTEDSIKEITANWVTTQRVVIPPEPPPQRLDVITRLVELARTAVTNGTHLRLRVDYRGKKSKP